MHNIERITTSFTCYDKPDVNKARHMFVNVKEQYLHEINQDEAIRPYLDQYPVPIEGYKLSILFRDLQGFPSDGSYVTHVFMNQKGHIIYDAWIDEKNRWLELHREPYSEAYEKIFGKPWTGMSKNLTFECVCN